jgi:hypothetical protein
VSKGEVGHAQEVAVFDDGVTVERSDVTALGTLNGKQTAAASGRYSIGQAGTASIQAAGRGNVVIDRSTVDLKGTIDAKGENTADATGYGSIAQAGVASIQAATSNDSFVQ